MGISLTAYRQQLVKKFYQSINNGNNIVYAFASKALPWTNDNQPDPVNDDYSQIYDTLNYMMFGKKVPVTGVSFMVNRHNWTSNTVYAQYDNANNQLLSSNFYVINGSNNVYKCLYNNFANTSTIEPTLTQNSSFTTSDGYVWKYLFNINTTLMNQFASQYYIPIPMLNANTLQSGDLNVIQSAYSGIDVIQVIDGGNNFITSVNGTIQTVVNTTVFAIDNYASADANFYTGCSLYIDTGPAAGAVRKIVNYSINSSGRWVTTNSAIGSVSPLVSTYQINPTVTIIGDGNSAIAVSKVANNSISAIVVVNPGNNFTHATVTVQGNTFYGNGALLEAMIPPPGGHGADCITELGATTLGFYNQFANTDSIPTNITYRSSGLMLNPISSSDNTSVYTSNTFSQLLKFNISPSVVYQVGETITGLTSHSTGVVMFSNSSQLWLSAEKTFANAEPVVGNTTTSQTVINGFITQGDLCLATTNTSVLPTILYINNIKPVTRTANTSEILKVSITI